jgi:DNA-binding response OmpR family regulator
MQNADCSGGAAHEKAPALNGVKLDSSANELGVIDWLEKPIDIARLQRAVRRAGKATPKDVEEAATSGRPRVLHVENDLDIVRIAEEILRNDADLDCAANLAVARAKLARNVYDLVILDVSLPDGDGLELLSQLKNGAQPTPVVVFSAHELSREDAQRTEAVLIKSRTSNETLLHTIRRLISRN